VLAAMKNVAPSHLMDRELFDFRELASLGPVDQGQNQPGY